MILSDTYIDTEITFRQIRRGRSRMIQNRYNISLIFTILLATIIVVLPASAITVAMYGTSSGFIPDNHADTVVVAASVPGSSGPDLDSHIDQFIDPSVDVIILGGEDTFSSSSAAKIETAVAGGKILIVTYPSNKKLGASLPASNGGTTIGGKFLELANPNRVTTQDIFNNLPSQYPLTGSAQDREQVVASKEAVILLNYDTGTPALLYAKYGKGYVIEWTTVPSPVYMGTDEADTINYRLITSLLPVPTATTAPTTAPTTVPETTTSVNETATTSPPLNATVTVTPTGSVPSLPLTGNVSAYSSPSGASILIDSVYRGTTPIIVTNIAPGKHSIRFTLSGYYDYEAPVYVTAGDTEISFGTLQPLNVNPGTPVATPIVVTVPVTAEPTKEAGLMDNSIIVAVIGVVTAVIGAVATIFTHKKKE